MGIRGRDLLYPYGMAVALHVGACAVGTHIGWPVQSWLGFFILGTLVAVLPFVLGGIVLSVAKSTVTPLVAWSALGVLLVPFVWLTDVALFLIFRPHIHI